ncbi:DUF3488 and transglutaminase-like domain-containing protein [uncultured Neptuniibacter sp.]|uniref:transglutaminase family protein n=1 Tax=uncultured Neptuniibacter sp. TaxID=502143 RepID=UPI0026315A4B|nr:DUF3488 and transglutaminase-like domain-containing protein [uncultured Neptuniibacter sp.]
MSTFQLSRVAILWQLLCVISVLVPHLAHLPLWVPVLVISTVFWRYMAYTGRWSFPNRTTKLVLIVAAGISVLLSYKSGGGISSTVALLVVGFGLKVLEVYKRRDALVIIYVAYLVIATAFLFNQTALMALYVLFSIAVITTSLRTVYTVRPIRFLEPFKQTWIILVPSLLLMSVLFIGIPRVGPLWEVGIDRSSAKTGLSDSMSPGDISKLTRSAEIAFRVSFNGDRPPPQAALYWRAMVMNDFDGRRWQNDHYPEPHGVLNEPDILERKWEYQIIIEPTQQKYIPALEHLISQPQGLILNRDRTLSSKTPLIQRQQFNLASSLGVQLDKGANLFDLERHLLLPNGNQKARALAHTWWRESVDQEAYIQKILNLYNREFTYSLTPPLLGDEVIDQFLFETKTGFCGHFSSTTAFMLRAVGIPARVVTGYQGGEWNPYENYLLVRQYDAHAWIEAWLDGKGWVRLDPTAWVAPERVEKPADQLFSGQEGFLKDSPVKAWGIKGGRWLAIARQRIEAFNYGWNRWVLNYHLEQVNLLRNLLGKYTSVRLALFLLIPFIVVIFITLLPAFRKAKQKKLNLFDREMTRLSEGLSKLGLSRAKGETVNEYCLRLGDFNPHLLDDLLMLSSEYEKARYADLQSIDQQIFVDKVTLCLKQLSR